MQTRNDATYDIVQAEVFRKGLDAIAEEMAITLMRTSGSPVVTDGMDFSTSVLDEQGRTDRLLGYVAFHVSTSFLGVAGSEPPTTRSRLCGPATGS